MGDRDEQGHDSFSGEVGKLVDSRDAAYGSSWIITNDVLRFIMRHHAGIEILLNEGVFFAWVMILNKVIRIMASPNVKDHWIDIMGYAELVRRRLES